MSHASKLEPTSVKRHPETGISVLVVGAGVGGLVTALECWRKGHEVQIVEKTPEPETEGKYLIPTDFATVVD
jgi:2-polyprenyl-6-methoxyphenol hydroxylase-like FAD-dependent oxidoreductase